MTSILFAVSEAIRVENCIGSIWTENPASLPISVIRSTITPWMLLVLVSRKVKGTPVGVEPTFRTCWAKLGPAIVSMRIAASKRRLKFIANLFEKRKGRPVASPAVCGHFRSARKPSLNMRNYGHIEGARSSVGAHGSSQRGRRLRRRRFRFELDQCRGRTGRLFERAKAALALGQRAATGELRHAP